MRALLLLAISLSSCVTPPPTWSFEGVELLSNDGSWLVRWRTEPVEIPLNAPFHIELQVLPADGSHPPAELSLQVDAAMPHHRHGMNRVPRMIDQGGGGFRAEGMLFHMEGRWELYFDVSDGPLTERAQVEVFLE
ncbi:MAG: hypothetical protein CL933_06780 [Deltaproteobacteria bacterium]|jgi:hypothetical protein|nr:hypothetical protein [Deltaproteobacteria bacterium]